MIYQHMIILQINKKDAIVSPTIAPLLLIRAYNIPYYFFDCYSCILFYTTIYYPKLLPETGRNAVRADPVSFLFP